MTLARWNRLEVLLEQVRALPAEGREAFIERESSDDPSLGTELAALLNASDGAEEYLGRLRQDLLGSGMQGILRVAAAGGDGPDPWIGRTISHYEIVERIGGGGMGVIYRARDSRLGRDVALKFIAPDIRDEPLARQRFVEEARAASALDHPNICTIHEIGETEDGRLFIVMPAYDGETLRSRLDAGTLPAGDALDVARQIAQALAAAHSRGIVHRDVKPDNVFLTRDGVVKLLDFGLARSTDHAMSGPIAGTVAYMSPEQAGGRRADARSDVWALGVILFEMLAGVRPFVETDPGTVLDMIRNRDPDFTLLPNDAPAEIKAAVRRALSREPAARFASGRDFLEPLSGNVVWSAAARPGRPRVASTRAGRIGAIAGVLVVGALGAAWIRQRVSAVPDLGVLPAGSVSQVLWVDDNPENNAEVVRQLESRGIRVASALNTNQAVREYDPAMHQLVVSDMGRFEGDNDSYVERAGLDLLARLKVRDPGVQVVFCTSARATRTFRSEALAAGARAIVEDCTAIVRMMGP